MLLTVAILALLLAVPVVGEQPAATGSAWGSHLQRGVMLAEVGQYEAAAHALETALGIAESESPGGATVAVTLNLLGSTYLELGRLRDAETCDRRSIMIARALSGEGRLQLCRGLENLAHLNAERANYDRAEGLIRRSLAIRREVLGPDHPTVAQLLNNLGEISLQHGREVLRRAGQRPQHVTGHGRHL